MAMTILATTGTFAAYTYITSFLTEVSRFPAAATGPLLLVRGVAGIVGVAAGGALVDRNPWAAMLIPVAAQATALPGLGVRSTALVGGLVSLAALAVVLSEPVVAATGRMRTAPSPPACSC
jgi:predicted MFS family arabinose efflux permease